MFPVRLIHKDKIAREIPRTKLQHHISREVRGIGFFNDVMKRSRLESHEVAEHIYTVSMRYEGEKAQYAVSLDGKPVYSVQGEKRMLLENENEPVRRFDRAMSGLEHGNRLKYACGDGGQFGGFLRKTWRELLGEDVEFPAQFFDVCLQDFLLHGESATAVKVVGVGRDCERNASLVFRLFDDEAELVELVENKSHEVGGDAKVGSDFVIIKVEMRTAVGKHFNKNLVFELRRDDGDGFHRR